MLELKKLSKKAVMAALEKADRYRFLNEPAEAESICRDVLDIEPDNQRALVTLVLALTDQFKAEIARPFRLAEEFLAQVEDEYSRAYYRGLVCERRGRAHLAHKAPSSGELAYDWLRRAMEAYDCATELAPADNEDAVLRWNACARLINHRNLQPARAERFASWLE